ncbi:MAG: hypothetical protein ACOZAK_01985 [Patescibacteria group bacterium]
MLEVIKQSTQEREKHPETFSLNEKKLLSCIEEIRKLIFDFNSGVPAKGDTETRNRNLMILVPWYKYLTEVFKHPEVTDGKITELISLTANILELVATDDITGMKSGTGFFYQSSENRSAYVRQMSVDISIGHLEVKSYNFLAVSEIEKIFSAAKENEILVQSIDELRNLLSGKKRLDKTDKVTLRLREPFIGFEAYETFLSELFNLRGKLNFPVSIYGWVKLNNEIGYLVGFSRTGSHFTDQKMPAVIDTHGVSQPLSMVPKSEIWRAKVQSPLAKKKLAQSKKDFEDDHQHLLDTWSQPVKKLEFVGVCDALVEQIANFSLDESLTAFLFILKNIDLESWQKSIIYKKVIRFIRYDGKTDSDKQIYLEKILGRHLDHYQEFFSDPNNIGNRPDVFLTRSGLSANGVALMIANDLFDPEDRKFAEMYGWYYENKPPSGWKETPVDEANILLVISEPNPPLADSDPARYFKQRNQDVKRFLARAKEEKEQRFVIILDKTTDLLDHSLLPKNDIPPNLLVIETASLTKHQRGGKSYFYGAISIWNNQFDHKTVNSYIEAATGSLTPDGIFALPRLTKTEVSRDLENYRELEKVFMDVLQVKQADIPENYRWQWQSYNYFGYLLPPKQILERYFIGKEDSLRGYVDGLFNTNALYHFFLREDAEGFDKGDSFGMNNTRFTHFFLKENDRNIFCLRMGFGRKTTVEQMKNFANSFCDEIVSAIRQLVVE